MKRERTIAALQRRLTAREILDFPLELLLQLRSDQLSALKRSVLLRDVAHARNDAPSSAIHVLSIISILRTSRRQA